MFGILNRWVLNSVLAFFFIFLSACPQGSVALEAPAHNTPVQVLMVVANDGFFFQEYFDPWKELETAGIEIEVASGLGGTATPHPGSYHNHKNSQNDYPEGVVPLEADRTLSSTLILSQQSAQDYDALVIVGGWGAARYYYDYPGVMDESLSTWAPNSLESSEMNRLIGEFLTAQKPVMGVCNGVNVLSWARIEGTSPLNGVSVSAPWGSAFPQSYPNPYPNGVLTAYTSDWTIDGACGETPAPNCFPMDQFAKDNGAIIRDDSTRLDPQGHARDSVYTVDGLIVTVQDNFAARAAGKYLAQRLLAP